MYDTALPSLNELNIGATIIYMYTAQLVWYNSSRHHKHMYHSNSLWKGRCGSSPHITTETLCPPLVRLDTKAGYGRRWPCSSEAVKFSQDTMP